jgi:hypothetical protein
MSGEKSAIERTPQNRPVPEVRTLKREVGEAIAMTLPSDLTFAHDAAFLYGKRPLLSPGALFEKWKKTLGKKQAWLSQMERKASANKEYSEGEKENLRLLEMQTILFKAVWSEHGAYHGVLHSLFSGEERILALPDYLSHSGLGQQIREVRGLRTHIWEDVFNRDFDTVKGHFDRETQASKLEDQRRVQKEHTGALLADANALQASIPGLSDSLRVRLANALKGFSAEQTLADFVEEHRVATLKSQHVAQGFCVSIVTETAELESRAETTSFDAWRADYQTLVSGFRRFCELFEYEYIAVRTADDEYVAAAKRMASLRSEKPKNPLANFTSDVVRFTNSRINAEEAYMWRLRSYILGTLNAAANPRRWRSLAFPVDSNAVRKEPVVLGAAPSYASVATSYFEQMWDSLGPESAGLVSDFFAQHQPANMAEAA